MKKILISAAVLLLFVIKAQAQQDPHYTQYMYNMNVINPAYAGSKENLSLGMLYRKQWVNMDGAPSTFTLSGHSPVGNKVGMGLSVISDKVGPVNENNIYGDFSYTLDLGGEHKLAMGIKAGATLHKLGAYSDINSSLRDGTDPSFATDLNSAYFNIGSGLFYYTDKYYISVSMPNFMKSKHISKDGLRIGNEVAHYFITGGYVFDLNPNLKFKPFALIKSAVGAPVSVDASANFLFNQKFEIGGTYRLEDSFGAMVNFAITPTLRIGYAYDHIVSELRAATPSSHEIIILYDVNLPKRVSRSARYF